MKTVALFILLTLPVYSQIQPDTTLIDPSQGLTLTDTTITITITAQDAALITYGLRNVSPGNGIRGYIISVLNDVWAEGRKERDKTIMNAFWSAGSATKISVANSLGIPTNTAYVIPK